MQLQGIDQTGHPIYYITHNALAAQTTRTTALWPGGSLGTALSGASAFMSGKLGMWDGGQALGTHQEFAGTGTTRIMQMDQSTLVNEHTTHLAGTLIAKGVNTQAKGMAFGANLRVWDFNDDIAEIGTAAKDLLLSNHSYGPVAGWVYNADRPGNDPDQKWEWWGNTSISQVEDYQFGFYSSRSSDIDRIAYSNPYYLMVRSADNKHTETGPPAGVAYYLRNSAEKSTVNRSRNDGYDVIAGEANAKNVLTVGSAEAVLQNNQPVSFNIAAYSGWGPTDDGRIKPDLLGAGTKLYSTISSATNAYGTNTGTSMASANVTGSLLLLQELYARLQNSSSEGRFMRAATLRGLAIHSADRINASGAIQAGIGPDYKQGWGVLNMEKAGAILLNTTGSHLLTEQILQQGGKYTTQIKAQGNEPLVVTICWTDPEAIGTAANSLNVDNRTPKLVNDLDVRLSDNQTTASPWVLDPANPDLAATTGDNIRDNVEQIVIKNPVAGKVYTLTVSHKGQLKYNAQPFSLIISGLSRKACLLTVGITPNKDTTFCAGTSITLQTDQTKIASSGGQVSSLTYEWLKNGIASGTAGGAAYQVTQAGTYAVRVTDSNGCAGTSAPVVVQLITPTATLTPSADQWLCEGRTSVQIAASAEAGTQFEWLRNGQIISGSRSQSVLATQTGLYQVRITQQGCQRLLEGVRVGTAATQSLEILPDNQLINLPRGASIQLNAPEGDFKSYQWLRNDLVINGATKDNISVNEPGIYKVKLTQSLCVILSQGRIIKWSDDISGDSLMSISADSTLTIYPNPAHQYIHIKYKYPKATKMSLTVYDVAGGVYSENLPMTLVNDTFEYRVDISALPLGYYFIRLYDGYRFKNARFFKY
ncbi:S8 family serine peptidase [Arsenicibacter rosenii]|nr:S8 family serine peptidase [Arsenicibacter rosenii]